MNHTTMQTFIAHLIFSISCEGVFTDQYEEQLRLVYAQNDEDAIRTAKKMATQEEEDFADRKGRKMSWKFIAVKDILRVPLEQGVLLHSSIKEIQPVAFV
jgi:hypothetical protein